MTTLPMVELVHRFNGAIAFQRWKVVEDQHRRVAGFGSFNGAIAFQRWKVPLGQLGAR